MRILRTKFGQILNNHLIDYPTPINVNYFWNLGALSGLMLALQLVTGIFIAMHYTSHVELSFDSLEHIMRDVNYGWALRYFHANGASMFFLVVYIHMARGIYFASYVFPRTYTWLSGVLIFILMMATAFIGYVLPWGQMSFWGATVITNLFSAIPLVGESIAQWIWGGFSVANPTLNRFFSLHFTLPFIILFVVILHLSALHLSGSSEPLLGGGSSKNDINRIPFYPYFYVKDLYGFLILLIIYSIFTLYYSNVLGHSDNYIEANPMVTPTHIVPEWYFLPFYAMLRSIPDKLGGVLCMGASLVILFFLPYLSLNVSTPVKYRLVYIFFCALLMSVFLFLGWIGAQPVEPLYVVLGSLSTIYYFLFFLFVIPILNILQK